MNVDYKVIGSRVQAQRKRRGLTQEVLAEKLDVTVGYVSQVERGATKISLDLLAAISAILGSDLGMLVSGTAVGNERYLAFEMEADYEKLSERERRLVLSFIRMLLENRV